MEKIISILGSTGSIGTQSLTVCKKMGYRVKAITAHSNWKLMEMCIRDRYGSEKIILGADVKEHKIAVNGWKDESACELFPFLEDLSLIHISYADRGDGGYEKLHPCMFGRDIVYSRI